MKLSLDVLASRLCLDDQRVDDIDDRDAYIHIVGPKGHEIFTAYLLHADVSKEIQELYGNLENERVLDAGFISVSRRPSLDNNGTEIEGTIQLTSVFGEVELRWTEQILRSELAGWLGSVVFDINSQAYPRSRS